MPLSTMALSTMPLRTMPRLSTAYGAPVFELLTARDLKSLAWLHRLRAKDPRRYLDELVKNPRARWLTYRATLLAPADRARIDRGKDDAGDDESDEDAMLR